MGRHSGAMRRRKSLRILLSYPRRRVPSTPRPVGSIAAVSGILDRPVKPGDDDRTHLRIPAAHSARALQIVSPKEKRAQGTPDACCTRGLVCKGGIEDAHEHTGTGGAFRRSLRNGFTAYAALSPETNSSCLRHRRIGGVHAPGRARNTFADLTPATGARTTRFCRTLQRRSSTRCVRSRSDRPANTPCAPNAAASTAFRAQRP